MSRGLTSAQVVELGEYLKPDFDPSTLTISQLRGVLNHHNINFPSSQNKSKLVQIFNEEVKTRAKKFTKERLKRENSSASEEGIVDGITGRPLNESKQLKVRRSGRLSKTPVPEEVRLPDAPVAPKRRRATAEPSLGGPSRRRASSRNVEPTVVEESEPEEPVIRKVGRPKKTVADAGSQSRLISIPVIDDPESGWEDNNIFQDSSSPVRPSPARTRPRKSSNPARPTLKARKSMSAPPDTSPSTPTKGKQRERLSSVRPPESSFEPDIPPSPFRPFKRELSIVQDSKEEEEDTPFEHSDLKDNLGSPVVLEAEEEVEAEADGEDDQVDQDSQDVQNVKAVAQRIAEGGALMSQSPEGNHPRFWNTMRVLSILLMLFTSWVTYLYKEESTGIGFCDTGSSTNAVLEGLRARRVAVEACNRENRTELYLPNPDPAVSPRSPTPTATPSSVLAHDLDNNGLEACPPPPLLPISPPNECTPCPGHATCSPSSITCENGFILRPPSVLGFLRVPAEHVDASTGILHKYERSFPVISDPNVSRLVYSAISYLFDGLPGFGPVAFPPRCVEDPLRKRHIGSIGRSIVSILAAERGRRLCEGVNVAPQPGDNMVEAQRWGLEVEKLREHLKAKTAPNMVKAFDDAFGEAIQEILQYSSVFMNEDSSGKRYLAHETAVMSLTCTAKVWLREIWNEWKGRVFGFFAAVSTILALRRRRRNRAAERAQIEKHASDVLGYLHNQKLTHNNNPNYEPRPYLSSLRLRDLVLQDIHSVKKRQQIWKGVERVVEANTNVQTNDREVEGGDEQRVWEWMGSLTTVLPPGTPGLGGRIVA